MQTYIQTPILYQMSIILYMIFETLIKKTHRTHKKIRQQTFYKLPMSQNQFCAY